MVSDWKKAQLQDVVSFADGTSFPLEYQGIQDGSFPIYKVGDMNKDENTIHMTVSDNTLTRESVGKLKAKVHPPETVIFPKVGAALLTNKRRILSRSSLFDNNVMGVVAKEGLDSKYLYYFMSTVDFAKHVQSGAVPSVNKTIVGSLDIQVPPLLEQRKIAAILTSIDDAIAATQRIIDQTEVVKLGLMQQLLTKGIGHTTFKQTEAGEIPTAWDVVRLEEIATVERGKFSHRPRNDPKFYGGDIPFVQTGDVTRSIGYLEMHSQTLNELGLSVSRSFPKGTILVTIAANIGETAIASYDVCFPDSLVGVIPNSEVNGEYLELALRMKKDALDKDATQSAQKNINLQNLRPLLLPLPPLEEQKKIAGTIYGLESKIKSEMRHQDALLKLKQSLMQVLLTGKVRVNVDEPSEVSV
ncbi:restriction endonuclease subunit S [Paenibacillus sp. GD4]|uniref:restriction endonuclease subunit S n=1 Tax=Paenibacillus sp. GD4 TaxID=3068890 RepID=UPI0027968243|nr:restriction endonuclease subunit S [Paenibacillus sp. GD4]MDQ1912310.1 restriction endonuclease subunit S [Paenibacillus sp. GD4]